MNREKNNSENDKVGNNKDSNQISEGKQELSDSNIVEDKQSAKHELINSNILEDSQNAKQELNDSNIVEDSQNAKQKLNARNIVEASQNAKNKETSKQNLNSIKTTEKIRDEEKSCKKDINRRMEHAAVRNNKHYQYLKI